MNQMKALIEGLIFLSGEEGLSISQIQTALNQETSSQIEQAIDQLKEQYQDPSRGFELVEYANRFKFVTKEFVYPYGEKLFASSQPTTLSQAALETLAIIAYKQPITRVEIEEIRGVGCDVMLKKLQARGLIEAKEHMDTVGRPLLYTVTETFFDAFQLKTLQELPELPETLKDQENLFNDQE